MPDANNSKKHMLTLINENNQIFINDWESGVYYKEDAMVIYNNTLYRCNYSHTSDVFEDDYSLSNWKDIAVTTAGDGGEVASIATDEDFNTVLSQLSDFSSNY